MKGQRGKKINSLMQSWPSGTVKTTAQLAAWGVSRMQVAKYVKQGWLSPVERGAYVKRFDQVDWLGGVYALQDEGHHFYPGGRTALEMQGYAHYAPQNERDVFVFGPAKSQLPAWFLKHDWKPRIVFSATGFLPFTLPQSFTAHEAGTFSIRIAAPERGVLELLYHVPQKVGFQEALQIVAGLSTLRPHLVQQLVETCQSIKVKRLFLYMAREAGHTWYHQLDRNLFSLGSGKREIVKGGKLDKQYQITVPRDGEESLF